MGTDFFRKKKSKGCKKHERMLSSSFPAIRYQLLS